MSGYQRIWHIAKANLRHNVPAHLLLAIAILCVSPLIAGLNNLDAQSAVMPLEMLAAPLGIVLLTPLFFPEREDGLEAVVRTKWTPMWLVDSIRLVTALVQLVALIGCYALVMRALDSQVGWTAFVGTLSGAVFLGGLGLITFALTGNIAAAYMTPVLYYLLCIGAGGNLGEFNVFSMTMREITAKPWQMAVGCACLFMAVGIRAGGLNRRLWRVTEG